MAGHLCLSRAMGQVFGHNMACWSNSEFGALRLFRAGQVLGKEWGADRILVHFTSDADPMIDFYKGRGFAPKFTVYEGAI